MMGFAQPQMEMGKDLHCYRMFIKSWDIYNRLNFINTFLKKIYTSTFVSAKLAPY